MNTPKFDQSIDVNGLPYDVSKRVDAVLSSEHQFIGDGGFCIFCETRRLSNFGRKKSAHFFPEALGNKNVFSLNECKKCNQLFSVYENDFAKAIGPFLTLGGVEGKRGVRNTGAVGRGTVVKSTRTQGRRSITLGGLPLSDGESPQIRSDGTLVMSIPATSERFTPSRALKVLQKIGLSLLPLDEIENYKTLREALQDTAKGFEGGIGRIAISFGMVGNAPPVISAVLLRKQTSETRLPKTILIFSAGSVCCQIPLWQDDEIVRETDIGNVTVNWRLAFGCVGSPEMVISYGNGKLVNWSSNVSRLSDLSEIQLYFNLITRNGWLVPVWK